MNVLSFVVVIITKVLVLNASMITESPPFCAYIDAATHCEDIEISTICTKLCTPAEDSPLCTLLDAATQCDNAEIAKICPNLCTPGRGANLYDLGVVLSKVDGSWGSWEPWSSCSKACGGGTKQRHRLCDDPQPAYGGQPCPGSPDSEDSCNTNACPIDANDPPLCALLDAATQCENVEIANICKRLCRADGGRCVRGIRVGSRCRSISEEGLSWEDAKQACESNNGHLATFTTIQDAHDSGAFIKRNYGSVDFWAGGSDTASEGNWVWVTGEPFYDYFPWGPAQPDNLYGEQDCLVVNWREGYDDAECRLTKRYMCDLGCPPGFFTPIGTEGCFKIFKDVTRSWSQANIKCEEAGYKMAKPLNAITAITLRKYLLEKYGDGEFWLGARGDGSRIMWNDGMELKKDNPLWWPGHPDQLSNEWCLSLLVSLGDFRQNPGRPYAVRHYEAPYRIQYTLCEVLN